MHVLVPLGEVCHLDRMVPVPTRNLSLTPAQNAFVEEIVRSGDYQNTSEAVRDALRALQQPRREVALKLEARRAQLKLGVGELDRGAAVSVEAADLERYLTSLVAPRRKRTRAP